MELPLHHHCQLFTAQNQDVKESRRCFGKERPKKHSFLKGDKKTSTLLLTSQTSKILQKLVKKVSFYIKNKLKSEIFNKIK